MKWNSKRYELQYPITVDGKEITSITIREPNAEALEIIDDLNLDQRTREALSKFSADQLKAMSQEDKDKLTPMKVSDMRVIIQAISREPERVIKELHTVDFSALGDISVPLIEGGEINTASTKSPSETQSNSVDGGEKTAKSSQPT